MPEIVDELTPMASERSGIIQESVGGTAPASTASTVIEDVIKIGKSMSGRPLSANAQRMIANIDKHGSVEDVPENEQGDPDDTPPAEAGAPAAAQATPPVEATATPPPEPDAELRGHNERLAARNAELVAEVEALKKRPQRELTKRETRLDEAERGYVDDSVGSLRKMLAVVLDVDDPSHKDVDAELSRLYQDLTERELQVAADPATKAQREAERTKLMLQRDRRDRAVQPEPPHAAAPEQNDEHVQLVATHLQPLAAEHPLLMAIAPALGGKPEQVILARIHQGFATGEYDRKTKDAELIRAAAKDIETRYQALADTIGKARPQPSTAAPTPATVTSQASPSVGDQGQSHGTRTITNASASVAPATPPAKKPEQPTAEADKPPKFKNEKARRQWLAERHFGRG